MYDPENLASAIYKEMERAGYGISDQLFNALEAEFDAMLEADQEDGDFSSADAFLDALEYAANRVSIMHNDQ